jgi:hypothetical protein
MLGTSARFGHLGVHLLGDPGWNRYFSIRNQIDLVPHPIKVLYEQSSPTGLDTQHVLATTLTTSWRRCWDEPPSHRPPGWAGHLWHSSPSSNGRACRQPDSGLLAVHNHIQLGVLEGCSNGNSISLCPGVGAARVEGSVRSIEAPPC